ncbi:MAG: helix-turn-helix transcriptional regulator [Eubacteriales bacterium]|nr:helix-turn-helix transcriptional regulator [Eubacteriales bacterium]
MFGDIVQSLRKSYGLSQVQLSQKLGVTKQAVSNWENNNILPSINMLIRISNYFSVSCDYLLELDQRCFIEVKGLTVEEIAHVQQVINDMKKYRPDKCCPH